MSSVMRKLRRKNRKCNEFQITASVTSLSLECETKDCFPWRLAIVWDRANPRLSSTKPVGWQGGLQNGNGGVHLWQEPDPIQNKFTLFKVSPSCKRKVIAVGSLDLSEYIKDEPASHDITVPLRPVKKSVLSGSLQFILSSIMLEDGAPRQSDKEVLDDFMKDAIELRRHSLQKASNNIEEGSKTSLQEASGSKAPMTDTAPTLQCDAATKAFGPLEAPSCSNNNTSGQRKVQRKLPPPIFSTKSRPAPPPPPRAVSHCSQPATSRPPRPPPPSVKGAKSSPKHNEEQAPKDGSSRRSARPRKCRSGLKTKTKYPKELNPFGTDTSLSSGKKTSKCDFPPELNPFSEEYNDEQASSNKDDTISSDVMQCDNEHSKTTFTQEHGELQDLKGENYSKLKKEDVHCSASVLGTSVSNEISNDETHFIPVESVESSPAGKRAPMRKEERTPMNEALTSGGETSIPVKYEDSSPSGKPAAIQTEEGTLNTTTAEVSTSNGDTSIYVEPVKCPPTSKEAPLITNIPEVLTSSGGTSIHVEPAEGILSGKDAPVQQDETTPITTMPASSTSSADTSICVEPVDSPPSGKGAPVQQEESAPITNIPEVSTSSGDTSIPLEPVEGLPSGKEIPVQQEETTPITTMPATSIVSADTSICVEPVDSPSSDREAPVQQEESTPITNIPEVSTSGRDTSIHVESVECLSSGHEAPVQQDESGPIATMPAASIFNADTSICVEPVDCPSSDKEAPVQQEKSSPITNIPEVSTSGRDTSIHVESVECLPSSQEIPVQQDESGPIATMPAASTSNVDTSICVEPVDSSPSGKEAPVQQEETTPITNITEVSTFSGDTSILVEPVECLPSGKDAPVQQEESTPITTMPEASTSSADNSIYVGPVDPSSSGKEGSVQPDESTPLTNIPEASTSGGDTFIPVQPVGSSLTGKEAAEQQKGSTPNTTVPEAAALNEASSIPKPIESPLSCKEIPVQQETLPITSFQEASTSSLACIIPVEPLESLACGKEVLVQQDERVAMPDSLISGEVLSIPVMPLESSLSREESIVQKGEGTLITTVHKAAVPSEGLPIPVELMESCPSGKEGPFNQEESAPSTAAPETFTSNDIHSVESLKASPPDRKAPLQVESTPTEPEASTCSESCSIQVAEGSPSEKKSPLHPEQRACSTTDRVASTAYKCEFPLELNPFSEEFNDEQGSSSEGDTISSDVKQCYNEPSMTEAASLIIQHCSELFSSIDEEVYLLQEEIASSEKVSFMLELEMQEAIKMKDCEEELDGLSQDWIGVANYRTELIRRKQDLESLATEKNLEECINGLRQELKYNLELEGWHKSEKHKFRDQLLLDALVSFVGKRDTGLKF